MMSALFMLVGQTAFAQRVPVACTGPGPFTIIGEDATSSTTNDAKIRISGALSGDDRVGYSVGNTYTGTNFAGTAKLSTLTGGYISQTLPTPTNIAGTEYTIRVYKADTTCYYDKVFTLEYVNFNEAPKFPDIQVSVAKTPDLGFYALGASVTIEVVVQNTGTGPATGVEYTVGIPTGLTITSGVPTYGTYDSGTKKWTIGNVAVSQSNIKLTLTGTVSSRGVKYLTADLTGENENDSDSRPTSVLNPDNSAGEDDYGSVCVSTPFDYCSNDEYTIAIANPAGIKWFKGTTEITAGNEASNGVRLNSDGSLTVFTTGDFSYSMTVGPNACPSGGCCPIRVEAGKPPVLVAPTAQAVCFAKSFDAVAASNTETSPNGTYIYQWYNDNGAANPSKTAITGQNSLAFTALPTAVGTYVYKLKAYEQGHENCADSITVTLEIKALPEPVLASNTPVCEESPLNLTATPAGATNYAWSGPSGFTGSNVANPSITSAALTSAGTYVVTVTNGVGCSATASTTVVINSKPLPPVVVEKVFCAQDPEAELTATALSGNRLLWYGTGGTVSSTAAPIVTPTSAGVTSYFVTQKVDATGCESNTSELRVRVNAKPEAPITAPVSACQNSDPITLTANAGSTGYTLFWYGVNSTGGTGSTTADIAPTASVGTTTYYVTKKDDATTCESNRATLAVEIRSTPVPVLASNSPVCAEATINLTATPSGATTYIWSGPSGFTGSNVANPTIANAATGNAGTYNVTVTNGVGCSASTSVVVVVNELPAAPAIVDRTICQESPTITLEATALSGNSILWYGDASTGGISSTTVPTLNPLSAGITTYYASQVSGITGCESHRSELVVDVKPKPLAPVAENKTYCQGVASQALAVTGAAQHTFLWYGQSATGGSSSLEAPVPPTNATGTTTYYVSQKDNTTGCESNRDDAIVIVNRTPAAPTIADVKYCQDATATALTASAETGNTIIWYNGGATSTTAPTPDTRTAGLTYFYVSQAIPGTGCESGMSGLPVTIDPKPVATVIAVNSLCIGTVSQNNAKLILTRYRNSDEVIQYNTGSTITGSTSPILVKPYSGGVFASNLNNPTTASQDYAVRIQNSYGCTIDRVATLTKTDCGCPGGYCEPATITKTK
ncbi:hypothetical protein EMA8858_01974 [Emticicia aquatica]|uniref:DUF11 domain-containing protein n=2 Tax=Emticicia aquatica TaxID=1681835 RepID=A0ABN8EVA5_9BACT|nr:hypothetical protein EMA8858_01974 [Emticicia aquatica]